MRGIVTVIVIIALVPCGDLVATLQAATPPAQSTYQSSGSPNPDEVRRVVMNLGVGQHVAVTLRSGETVRGDVREIADDHFVLLLDRTTAPADIAYGDVRQLGPILQPVLLQPVPWWKRAPSKGVIVGIIVIAILEFVSYTVQGCSHTRAC